MKFFIWFCMIFIFSASAFCNICYECADSKLFATKTAMNLPKLAELDNGYVIYKGGINTKTPSSFKIIKVSQDHKTLLGISIDAKVTIDRVKISQGKIEVKGSISVVVKLPLLPDPQIKKTFSLTLKLGQVTKILSKLGITVKVVYQKGKLVFTICFGPICLKKVIHI